MATTESVKVENEATNVTPVEDDVRPEESIGSLESAAPIKGDQEHAHAILSEVNVPGGSDNTAAQAGANSTHNSSAATQRKVANSPAAQEDYASEEPVPPGTSAE